jgi:hypothetical protein
VAKSPTEQIRDVAADVKVLHERDETRRREVERLTTKAEAVQAELAALRQENAVLR